MARVGMKHLMFAPIATESASAAPTYGDSVVVGRAVRGARTPVRYDGKLYGDDGIAESYNGMKEITMEVETTELEEANAVAMGIYKAVGTGTAVAYRQTNKPTAFGGWGWVETHVRKGVEFYVAIWVYKAQLAPGAVESRTRGDNLEYGTDSLTGTSLAAFTDSDGEDAYYDLKVCTTLAAAIDWLESIAPPADD